MLRIRGGLEALSCTQRWDQTRGMRFNVMVGLAEPYTRQPVLRRVGAPLVMLPSPQRFTRVSHSVAVSVPRADTRCLPLADERQSGGSVPVLCSGDAAQGAEGRRPGISVLPVQSI